jgi:phospholipid transport system substrate-binding protein
MPSAVRAAHHTTQQFERSFTVKNRRYLQGTKQRGVRASATIVITACLVLLIQPVPVAADAALEALRSSIGRITSVLDDKAFRESHSREELNEKLIEVAQDRFNWEEIAKRSLGLYWKERSPEEKKEFTLLLKDLLINTYLDKIVDNYSGETILYDKEIVKGKLAFIDLRIINKAEKSIDLGIRMLNDEKQWLIYDLIIEGVSSLKNYRVQFYDIIRQSSYEALIKKLKDKTKKEAS